MQTEFNEKNLIQHEAQVELEEKRSESEKEEIFSHGERSLDELYEDWQNRKKMLRGSRLLILGIIVAVTAWSWHATGFELMDLVYGTTNMITFIFEDLLPPDFSTWRYFLNPVLETIYMSYVGTFIAIFISVFFALLAAENLTHPIIAIPLRSFIAFMRAFPSIVIALLMVAALGAGGFAGAMALGVSGIGLLAKAYADMLEEIDEGQLEAVRATGANWFQLIGQGVWPQFKPGFVGWSLYRMDLNIREASILGLVGAGGVGYALDSSISLFQYRQAALGIFVIWCLILVVEFLTAKLRESLL